MDLLATSDYVICKPYSFSKNQSGLIVSNNTDCFAKIVSIKQSDSELTNDDVIWYDLAGAIGCSINGEKYIAVKRDSVISRIEGG